MRNSVFAWSLSSNFKEENTPSKWSRLVSLPLAK